MYQSTKNCKNEKIIYLKAVDVRGWLHMPIILPFGRQMHEGHKFKGSLVYIVRPCLKKTEKQQAVNMSKYKR
jgi:hypothetical protein